MLLFSVDLSPLLAQALTPILLALLSALGLLASRALHEGVAWLKAHTKNANAQAILDRAEHFVTIEVGAIAQTELPKLSRDLQTGKLTKQAAEQAASMALVRARTRLGEDGIKELSDVLGSRGLVNAYLASVIENAVRVQKNETPPAQPTPPVAPATTTLIDDVEEKIT